MASISALNISGTNYEIVASSALWAKSGTDFSANSINVNGDVTANTINGNELVVNGAARVLGTLYADTIEGKITSAGTADIANSIKANYSNTTLSAGYATATNTAIKVNSAITAQTALHLTATVADNYSALSAGSAKLAGTATSAGQARSGRWSMANDSTDLDRVIGFGIADASAQWIAGNEFYNATVYDKALTFNSKTDTLKSPNISANTISGTTIYDNGTALTNKYHYGNGSVRYTLGNGDNNASSKYVCIASAQVGNWTNLRLVADVLSRHHGNGIVVFNLENNNAQVTNATLSAGSIVNYYGSTTDFYSTDNYHIFVKADTSAKGYVYVVTRHQDYSNIGMNILAKHDGIKIALGAATGFAVAADLTAMSTALGGAVNVRTAPLYASMNNHSHSNYVPTGRKVNGKVLSADVTLNLSDLSNTAHNHDYKLSANTTAFNVSGGVSISAGSNITITSAGTNIIKIAATDTNTDTKVHQSNTITNTYRPIILGYTNSTQPSALSATTAEQVYVSTSFYYKPSDGSLYNNGNVTIQKPTEEKTDFSSNNPKLIFANRDGSQQAAFVYTDYDTVVAPMSVTLTGYQNGESNVIFRSKTVSGVSAKFDSISAKNTITANVTSANQATSAIWTSASDKDLDRPIPIPYTAVSGSWNGNNVFYSPMCYAKSDLTFNSNKKLFKATNTSSTTMSSNNYTIENKARMQYNSTDDCIDFLFV